MHGGVIQMTRVLLNQCFNNELLHSDIGLHQGGQLRWKTPDARGLKTVAIDQHGNLDDAI
jgi:hypothetical protein